MLNVNKNIKVFRLDVQEITVSQLTVNKSKLDRVSTWIDKLASVVVAVSFLMKSINKLRIVNTLGAICFVIYSVAIKAWPVALINFFIICVNIYHLTRKDVIK